MSRDLFEEYGIEPPKSKNPRDLFEEENIYYPKESKGLGGIASDAYHKGLDTIMGIPSQLMALPGEIYGAGKQAINDPKRALQNIGAGFGELGHNILSSPGNIRDYLEKKDLVSHNAPSWRLPESVLPKEYNYPEAMGIEGQQSGDMALRGLPTGAALAPLAEAIPGVLSKIPGVTNKSIANQLSRHKERAVQNAMTDYNNLFNDVNDMGVNKVKIPKLESANIIKHSQPAHHEALQKFLKDPTFENAHWAQSDLGFIVRHLKKLDEKGGLASPQHKTLKDAIMAQNRLKESMFKDKKLANNPELKERYNNLSGEYAKNVVPYKQLQDLSHYENKKMTANNLIKSLLNDDEFMLGLGQKYKPQFLANKALRSNIAKLIAGGTLSGLGFEEGRKLIK